MRKAGIPVPGTPLEMMPASWASERRCALAPAAMLTALSLPRPSSPWHAAQLALKVVRPDRETEFESGGEEEPGFVCGNELGEADRTRNSPNGNKRLRIGSMNGQHSNPPTFSRNGEWFAQVARQQRGKSHVSLTLRGSSDRVRERTELGRKTCLVTGFQKYECSACLPQ